MTFHFRTRTSALVVTLGVSTALLLGAAPAQAHDELTSTTPAQDETITTDPGKVSLTLTQPPLNSDSLKTSVIKVTAPDGHVASTGEVTVEGPVISTAAEIDHPGKYTVAWRAVSADGHPIEGNYSFTFAGAATASTATASAAPSPASTATQAAAPASDSSGAGDNTGLLIGAGVIILGLIGAVVYLMRRRNKPVAGA